MRATSDPSDPVASYPSVPLGSVLSGIESGWSPSCDSIPPAADEWGVLKVSAVSSGRFAEGEAKRLPEGMGVRPSLEVRPGDVLLTRANGVRSLVGVACYVSTTRAHLMLSDKTLRVVPRPSVDPAFLALLLSSQGVRRQIGGLLNGGTGQNNISQADVRELRVPDVPLDEQRRIVAVHAAFERRIRALQSQADKRAALLSGLAESLFKQRVDQLVELGSVPGERQSGVTLGAHRAPRHNAVGYLRVANVRKGWIDADDIAVLESQERDRPRYELAKGDVLVVEGHANPEQIGRAAVVDESVSGLLYQNHLFRLRFDDVIPDFAALWLNASVVRSYWRTRCTTSSGLYTINSKLLAGVPFPQLGLEEQRQIIEACRVTSRSVESAKQQIRKIQMLQDSAVEDLLAA